MKLQLCFLEVINKMERLKARCRSNDRSGTLPNTLTVSYLLNIYGV
jgi:hypothetical protein